MSLDIYARPWAQITLTPLTERRSEEGEKALPTMSLSQYTQVKVKNEEALASRTMD